MKLILDSLHLIPSGGRVHFIGIGGISMSALALVMMQKGFRVTGSDLHLTPMITHLESKGAQVFLSHRAENVGGANLVVYTAAVQQDNPERAAAAHAGIPMVERPVLLGLIMDEFPYPIAISGTHGKTTVTSMLSHILIESGCDPTIMVGGELDKIGGNLRTGAGEYFLAEACEYHRSFLSFRPFGVTVLNVEPDHLDYFKDKDDYESAYEAFVSLVPSSGYVVALWDDIDVQKVVSKARCRIISYGLANADAMLRAVDVQYAGGLPCYLLEICGEPICRVCLRVAGRHNLLNSLAALANAYALGLDMSVACRGIEDYEGVKRRLEYKGEVAGVAIYDDYAHHPTEIMASLSAARDICDGRLICIFQPHTYSRTFSFFDDFASAFGDADEVILADIYAAREKDEGIVSSSDLAISIRECGRNAIYLPTFEKISSYAQRAATKGDMIITMGAGDIFKAGEIILNNSKKEEEICK